MCTNGCLEPAEAREGVRALEIGATEVISYKPAMWVLGTEPRPPARAINALNS